MTDPVDLSQSKIRPKKTTSTALCPICGKPTVSSCRPFCSKRCAHLDLANWFNEEYTIPVREEDLRDDERAEDSHGLED